ncbi:MAG: hypothetical protein MZU84_00780 [Sphingobacterium sp.]|nr:hypothetical protein [Sphingobacterium sp.]
MGPPRERRGRRLPRPRPVALSASMGPPRRLTEAGLADKQVVQLASMGPPRSWPSVKCWKQGATRRPLQWGRRRGGESAARAGMASAYCKLQSGPPRGERTPGGGSVVQGALGWAAAPLAENRHRVAPSTTVMLQWGRRANAAKGILKNRTQPRNRSASMGPPRSA